MRRHTRRAFVCGSALLLAISFTGARAQTHVTPAEARVIAKEAYVYGFPIADSYRVTYAYFVDRMNPEYKGPINQIRNFAHLMTPADKAVQTPNSDKAYSFLGLDLRAEPVVITAPKVTDTRYSPRSSLTPTRTNSAATASNEMTDR